MTDNNEDMEKSEGYGVNGNLTAPKPGEVRNPNGRPRGSQNRRTLYQKLLDSNAFGKYNDILKEKIGDIPSDAMPVTVAEQIVMIDMLKAMEGNEAAIERVFNNTEGKIADKIDHSGDMGFGDILAAIQNKPPQLPATALKKKEAEECQTTTQNKEPFKPPTLRNS